MNENEENTGAAEKAPAPDNKTENYEDSIEYLRAKYLGKGTIDHAKIDGGSRADGNGAADGAGFDDLDALRKKYGRGGASSRARDPLSLACDIILLCAVIVVALASVIWFAAPTTEVGGVVYKAGTQNIYSFFYGAENSVINQFKAAIDGASNIESDAADGVSSSVKVFRLAALAVAAVYAMINIIVRLIQAPIYFAQKSGVKLRMTATKAMINNIAVYVIFVFCGSVSGGVGEDAYYLGYSVGTGMTVGVILGLCMLVAAVIIGYIAHGKTASAADRLQMRRSIVSGACYSAIAVTLTFMRIYGVFMYALTSTLTAIAGAAIGSFRIKAFVFPLLNLLVFASCVTVYNRTARGFTGAFMYMLNLGNAKAFDVASPAKAKKMRKSHSLGFVPVIVMSALSAVAVLLLDVPAIGFGWSADILPHIVAIFAISSCGQICLGILFPSGAGGRKKSAKRVSEASESVAAESPETESAERAAAVENA